MKPWKGIVCLLSFALICIGVWLFLSDFARTEGTIPYLDWETSSIVDADGQERTFDPLSGEPQLEQGERFLFTLTLPQRKDGMYLLFETSGGAITLTLGDERIYSSEVALLPDAINLSQAHVTIPAGGGELLAMEITPTGPMGFFPPILRLTDDPNDQAGTMAYANFYAFPTGATALALVVLWGLFLLGVVQGRAPWKLLLLLFAAAVEMFRMLAIGFGTYFLSPAAVSLLGWRGWPLLGMAALVGYLLLHREKAFWKALGVTVSASVGTLLVCWGISFLRGGYLAQYLQTMALQAFTGYWDNVVYWLSLWLVAVCALLSGWEFVRKMVKDAARNRALELKDQLMVESYHAQERRLREGAALRHETAHRLVALGAMLQEGDLAGASHLVEEWQGQETKASPLAYSANPAVNAMLQSAASQASQHGIAFQGKAHLPEKLPLPLEDLCALLLNMLDNALDAAAQVEPESRRFVHVRISFQDGFLGVQCINSYAGNLRLDDSGELATTKPQPEIHGFGISKMREVAAAYHSMLDISYTEGTFTVQTALKLPES